MTETFDYIIAGAGAAGCVLANRLSADPDKNVLLLEAGPTDRHPFIHMPKGVGKILSNPDYTWPFFVEKNPEHQLPPSFWVRGKTLGGSTSTNGMVYVRGQPADFEALAAQTSQDWGWKHIEAAYQAIETNNLKLTRLAHPQPTLERAVQAGSSLGLERVEDINEPGNGECIGYCPQTIWRGRRQSAAVAFLKPVRKRKNLTIRTNTLVDRVIFDGQQAKGLKIESTRGTEEVYGRRIIISAGTMGSPAILQRSGIGERSHLDALGIPVVSECPEVGQNLFEHSAITLQWRLNSDMSVNRQLRGRRLPFTVLRYLTKRSGPLSTAAFDVGAWFKLDPSSDRPDAQLLIAPHSIDRTTKNMSTEAFPGMQMVIYPLRPRSRGYVKIRSRDASDLPQGELDQFSNADDRRELVSAVQFARQLAKTRPLADIIEKETRPGADVESDEDIIDAYRKIGTPGYHAGGTCRMGADESSVVDPQTRVRNTENLHVIDLSIFPQMPSGNTFAPVAAIAWRGADLISRDTDVS